MNDLPDDMLDFDRALLARRGLDDADGGAAFVDRILRAAALMPANANTRLPWYAPILRLAHELLPAPVPAYAMPALMVVGIAIGFLTGLDTATTSGGDETLQTLIYSTRGMI